MKYYSYLTVIKDKQSGRVLEKRVTTAVYRKRIWELKIAANDWAEYKGLDRNNIKIEVSKL